MKVEPILPRMRCRESRMALAIFVLNYTFFIGRKDPASSYSMSPACIRVSYITQWLAVTILHSDLIHICKENSRADACALLRLTETAPCISLLKI